MGIVDARSTIRFLYNRSNIFRLSDFIEDPLEDEEIRKLAIKTGLDMLILKIKRLDIESSFFFETLQKVGEIEENSVKLRNIANYILEQLETEKQKMENLNECISLFIKKLP